ncbi:hypothetical protein C1H46_000229 [Malus baccata]|uniref:No apical meristem-associated C-terminal domain-containing protein n=1 Tax=Malus baccata TaxID=106549 RepID=A0A540NV06_MALBA|nr:hypothetical protein C1H46_000229 [Malus baccata]
MGMLANCQRSPHIQNCVNWSRSCHARHGSTLFAKTRHGRQEGDTFEDTEGTPEEVLETQLTRQSLRPQGKKASKKKGSSSKNDYTKYMEELACQVELKMAQESTRDEEKAATMATILATTERHDAAAERQREIVNR